MKSFLTLLTVLGLSLSSFSHVDAFVHDHEIYPEIIQTIQDTKIFLGDRHGDFKGDPVAILSDGSAWKVHPKNLKKYQEWGYGDVVRVMVRTDFYWFKREHKFALYNYTRNESVKVMLIYHKQFPITLKIEATDTYCVGHESYPETKTVTVYRNDGTPETVTITEWKTRPVYRKALALSDGSVWEIKDSMKNFVIGTRVYVGAQCKDDADFDFVLICGNEREAKWAWASRRL